MWFARREIDEPWEVVDSKCVEPVPMYDDDEDLQILRVSDTELSASYEFDRNAVRGAGRHFNVHAALLHTRSRLRREAAHRGYNILLTEGWSVTLRRKRTTRASASLPPTPTPTLSPSPTRTRFSLHAPSLARARSHGILRARPPAPAPHTQYRIAVQYTGRPAGVAGVPPPRPPPPFEEVLAVWRETALREYLVGDCGAEQDGDGGAGRGRDAAGEGTAGEGTEGEESTDGADELGVLRPGRQDERAEDGERRVTRRWSVPRLFRRVRL